MTKSRCFRRERGAAMVYTLSVTVTCAGVAGAMIGRGVDTKLAYDGTWARAQRLHIAQAGIAEALFSVNGGGTGVLGDARNPVQLGAGAYFVEAAVNAEDTITVTSRGSFGGGMRSLRAVLRATTPAVFDHALYAGNSSGDPTYVMDFGGTGTQADEITGDVYSGNDLTVTADVTVDGTVRARGTITGIAGESGVDQPGPGLAEMHYETNHDVNVAAEFAAHGTSQSNALGGTAIEVPQTNRAHIFRKNPSDRTSVTATTAKDDYFLEDPGQRVNGGRALNESSATRIDLTGDGNNLVYYVDGNLWVHNLNIYSFVLKHSGPDGVRVTFVVKGNIYVSDNILLSNRVKDGIALVAVKDPAVTDSGNVYFGDSVFGTLEEMDAYMYAENNFFDRNLDASGSAVITVKGVMSAGNQVAIQRDFGTQHTKLVLDFDDRIREGSLVLPGLPATLAGGPTAGSFTVISCVEVGSDGL